jgi:primase-polymerase (primpol)-like protein
MGESETFMDRMTARPVALIPKPDAIPGEIKSFRAWVVWRYEWIKQKWTKVPYPTVGGSIKASSTDPSTWGTFSDAIDRYGRGEFDGIGFVLDPKNEIAGVDLDHCVGESTAVWAMKIMFQLDSYTELSPSGTGLRILLKGAIPPGGRKKNSIEMYDSARYLTITGHHRARTPLTIESRQEAITALHTRVFAEEPGPRLRRIHSETRLQLTDNELLEKALRAPNGHKIKALYGGDWSGYFSQSQADLALCDLLGFYTRDDQQLDRLIRSSGLYREKWDERRGDGTYGQRTIAKALGKWN